MLPEYYTNENVINKLIEIIKNIEEKLNINVVTLVLLGEIDLKSKVRNSYEFLILLDDKTNLTKFQRFLNNLKLELARERLKNLDTIVYTPEVYEKTIIKDKYVGTYLYILSLEYKIIFDKVNNFSLIQNRILSGIYKSEETYLKQCLDFSKKFDSKKWEMKWERELMNLKYKRRTNRF